MSRVNYKLISNKEAVPIIKHDLFSNNLSSRFATVCLGFGFYPKTHDRELFLNYLRLRKNVYIDQTGMLERSLKLADGTETDDDDKRSLHIIVAENKKDGNVAIIGCVRLIVKTNRVQKLPIEEFYPELFSDRPAAVKSAEMSRFISRADVGNDNYLIILSLCRMAMSYIDAENIQDVYGVIEEDLEQAMLKFGDYFKRVAEPKVVREYNDVNLGIKLDLGAIRNAFSIDGAYDYRRSSFWGSL